MTRKECCDILGISEKAGLAELKSAYRRLAFELHPDLHPDLPDAARRFQRLNEAYVLLLHDKTPRHYKAGKSAWDNPEDRKARQDAGKAYSQAKARFDKDFSSSNSAQAESGPNRPDEEAKEAPPRQDVGGKSREDVLKDILEDPFARRVFEDIYRHARPDFNSPRPGSKNRPSKPVNEEEPAVQVAPGLISSITSGVVGGVKGWLRRQSDDEQTIALPRAQLVPGARLRLKIHRGFAGKTSTVELTLPPDFVAGQPVRLRGLGKKVGSIQGDLYLTLVPKKE